MKRVKCVYCGKVAKGFTRKIVQHAERAESRNVLLQGDSPDASSR
jgi:hypothetical protein